MRGEAASGSTFWALLAAASAAGKSPARASAWLWRTSEEEESGIATATIAATATATLPIRSGSPNPFDLPSRPSGLAVSSTEASSSSATGSTGSCHIQSKLAVTQKATHPASARRQPGSQLRAGPHDGRAAAEQDRRESSEQDRADDPQLAQRLHVERVRVLHRFAGLPSRDHQYSKVPEPVPISGFVSSSRTAELQNW